LSIGDAIELVLIASAATRGSIPPRSAEQQPFAEGEGLNGEADVDRELDQQSLAVAADVGDGLAELAQ
jgi:hypothetical protein